MKPDTENVVKQIAKLKLNSPKDWMIAAILMFNVLNSLGGFSYATTIAKSVKEFPEVMKRIDEMKKDIKDIQDTLARNKIAGLNI
jgi:hypothetical protein